MDHPNFPTVVRRIIDVCRIAAPRSMLVDLRRRFDRAGLSDAVACHDSPALFDWLMPVLSYQGVSDAIAWAYMDRHGTIRFEDVALALAGSPHCRKLRSYWDFAECRFAKQAFSCSEPGQIERCSLPQHDLRNGRLNQTAYSLYLFLRDVCDGDLVGWIDGRFEAYDQPNSAYRAIRMREAVLQPLSCIHGISSKVLSMALADLLLAGDPARERWTVTGASMIAVDTLVHNWLHRSGCLRELGADHAYGPGCYARGGCTAIIEAASAHIDARQFCPEGPANFPRLVQKAIWLFCTEGAHDICNGNRIDDRLPCDQVGCPMYDDCARLPLRPTVIEIAPAKLARKS